MTPCRVVDMRNPNGPLAGPYLLADRERDFPVPTSSCVPTRPGIKAYSFNVTAVPHPTGQRLGFLMVWPRGAPVPNVSTLNNPTGTIGANAAIVPTGITGDVAVYPNDDTDLLIDINGYFAAPASDSAGASGYASAIRESASSFRHACESFSDNGSDLSTAVHLDSSREWSDAATPWRY
jgi:hypothetical protein